MKVMSLKYFLFLFLAACVFTASAKKCPEGSVESVTNPDMCYTWTTPTGDNPFATYDEAETACTRKGGHLATIPNQKENNYLSGIIEKENYFLWIGINDMERYGTWKWEDGSSANYLNWDQHGPGTYHCGVLMQSDGSWRTNECGVKMLYICSIPAI